MTKNKIKVLYVDDDSTILILGKVFLERAGFEIVTALNAETAMRIIPKYPFDVIISDHEMPGGMNGITFLKTIRQEGNNLPFFLFTGSSDDIAEEAYRNNALYFRKDGRLMDNFSEISEKIHWIIS